MNTKPTNRIPSSVFFSKPAGSMDLSLTSNDSIFSLHKGNVSISKGHGLIGLAAALKLDETQKSNESVNQITGTSLIISLPPVNHLTEEVEDDGDHPKDTKPRECHEPVSQITETNPVLPLPPVKESQGTEKSDSESDDEDEDKEDDGDYVKEMIKPKDSIESVNHITETNVFHPFPPVNESQVTEKSDSESDDEDDQMIETNLVPPLPTVKESQDTEKSDSESDDEDEDQKEDDDDYVMKIIADDLSICCLSDTSNSSFSSFAFPISYNEDGSVKTPSMEPSINVFNELMKLSQEKTQMRRRRRPQFYFISGTHPLTQIPPPRNSSSKQALQTQSRKSFRNRWFSCFNGQFERH